MAAAASLAGCYNRSPPTSDETYLARVRVESARLMQNKSASVQTRIPQRFWPKAIAGLRPSDVYVDRDGLFILISVDHLGYSGYLITKDNSSLPGRSADHSRLAEGVYWYETDETATHVRDTVRRSFSGLF